MLQVCITYQCGNVMRYRQCSNPPEAPGADDSDGILLRPEAADLDRHLEHGQAGGEESLEEVRTAEYLPASITHITQ